MKKLSIISLVFCLTLLTTGTVLGAPHNFTSDFSKGYLLQEFRTPKFGNWYYIEKDNPLGVVKGSFGDNNFLGAQYFINDQTFANLYFTDPDVGDSITYFKGSYLFDNHFFVGLDYGDSQITLSPGYRYDINKNSYLAASLDYAVNDELYPDSGWMDVEIVGRRYDDQSRLFGQLIIPNEDVTGSDEMYILLGGAYKVSPKVVVGGKYESIGDTSRFEAGFTGSFDKLVAELKYIVNDDDIDDECHLNFLYAFTKELRAGVEQVFVDDESYQIIKAQYQLDNQKAIGIAQQLENKDINKDSQTYVWVNFAL